MAYKFCKKCGGKNEYTLTKPKFCNHCGSAFETSFSNVSASQPQRQKNQLSPTKYNQRHQQNFEEEESSGIDFSNLRLSKSDIAIERDYSNTVSFKDLINTASENEEKIERPKGNYDKSSILKELSEECRFKGKSEEI